MMTNFKEIEYRGKKAIDNSWVYGYGVYGYDVFGPNDQEVRYLIKNNPFHVYGFIGEICLESTIGRSVGFEDKTGKSIFSGDILQFEDTGYREEVRGERKYFSLLNTATVVWRNGRLELDNFKEETSQVKEVMKGLGHEDFIYTFKAGEVIGNIYD